MKRKIFAVSDIHGEYKKLKNSLNEAGFNPLDETHKLVICGDLFDRGTQNLEVYEYIRSLEKNHPDQIVVLRGNHEYFFYDVEQDDYDHIMWNIRRNGFGKTLTSFTGLSKDNLLEHIRMIKFLILEIHPELLDWVMNLPFYYETKNYVFTHAGIDLSSEDWREGNWKRIIWNDLYSFQDEDLKSYGFTKKLVMGHFPTSLLSGKNHNEIYHHQDNQKIFIDGAAAYHTYNQFNILIVEDEEL